MMDYINIDVLSDVLSALRARGTVYFCDHLEPPWTKTFNSPEQASFHQVRQGSCWARSDIESHFLGPGDLVFLGPSVKHELVSEVPDSSKSENQTETLLMCGYCEISERALAPIVELFPRLCVLRNEQLQQMSWLNNILDKLSFEYQSSNPGSQLVVNKLTEIMMVELLRINFGRSEQINLITALSDNLMARALESLHMQPEKNWTLNSLGEQIGISRSGLAKRFKEMVGIPMFEYLTQLRVQRAKDLLLTSDLKSIDIAERVGYESNVAFTKTFKKQTGETPTQYRNGKQARVVMHKNGHGNKA